MILTNAYTILTYSMIILLHKQKLLSFTSHLDGEKLVSDLCLHSNAHYNKFYEIVAIAI